MKWSISQPNAHGDRGSIVVVARPKKTKAAARHRGSRKSQRPSEDAPKVASPSTLSNARFVPAIGGEIVQAGSHSFELRPTYMVPDGHDPAADTARALASRLEQIAERLDTRTIDTIERARLRRIVARLQRSIALLEPENSTRVRRLRLCIVLDKWASMNGTLAQRAVACQTEIVRELGDEPSAVDVNLVSAALVVWTGRHGRTPVMPTINALFKSLDIGVPSDESLRQELRALRS